MLQKINNLPLVLKLASVQFIVALALFAAAGSLLSNKVSGDLEDQAVSNLTSLNGSVIDTIDVYRKNLENQTDTLLRMFASYFPEDFVLDEGQTININGTATPKLRNGNFILNRRKSEVDRFSAVTDATATVFARQGDDFIRITTSVKKENGERAVGTYLGESHPGHRQLLAGAPYVGAAKLFGRDYMTRYEPIKNSAGHVIGILYIGLDFTDSLQILKKKIRSIQVGETGYVYVLDAKPGATKGTFLVHRVEENERRNVLKIQDATGREFVREMLEAEEGVIDYLWINEALGETQPRLKIAAYSTYPEWQWMVASGSYLDEFNQKGATVRRNVLQGGVVTLLAMMALLYLCTRYWMAKPLRGAVSVAKAISAGDLDNPIQVGSQDEVGQLLHSLCQMQTTLRERLEKGQAQAIIQERLNQALEKVSANVMMADLTGRILYVNEAGKALFSDIQDEVRESLPSFDASAIVGTNIDSFHKEPQRVKKILEQLQDTRQGTVVFGGRTLRQVVNPVIDNQGERLGTVVEWIDLTEQLANETHLKTVAEREREQAEALQHKVDELLTVVGAAAAGDLTQSVTVQGEDAIGQMGQGLEHFLAQLRTSLMAISHDARGVAEAADELGEAGQKIDGNAQTTAHQASTVAASAEQVSANVNTMAAAAEEMNASIREIAHNASTAAQVAAEAVALATSTDTTVRELSNRSADIGQVLRVITGIAEQTNLLALNATIEAARAGEAGKGFAVVANEVKELAKETAKATGDVGQKITAIQEGSSDAVEAIARINATITRINDIQTNIASAVEQQTATTNEISRNAADAARGSADIAQHITQVARDAQTTLDATAIALNTASDLTRIASELQRRVNGFTLEAGSAQGEQRSQAVVV